MTGAYPAATNSYTGNLLRQTKAPATVKKSTHERREEAERARRGGLRRQRTRGGAIRERVLTAVVVVRRVCGERRREEAHFEDARQAREHEGVAEHRVHLPHGEWVIDIAGLWGDALGSRS